MNTPNGTPLYSIVNHSVFSALPNVSTQTGKYTNNGAYAAPVMNLLR